MNDERLLEALPLSYLSVLLTGDFHPCPAALLSSLPPSLSLSLSLIVLPQESDRFHLHYLAPLCSQRHSSFMQLCGGAVITARSGLLFGIHRFGQTRLLAFCKLVAALLCFGVGPVEGRVRSPDAARLPQGNHVTVPWEN